MERLRQLRYYSEASRDTDLRTPAQLDRDRILYSPHLARLAEVTQVHSMGGDFVVHNRLTHSLKVAQLARRIAEVLLRRQPELAKSLELDPDVAEAAGLAHDLGHPPFGHIAEEKLNALVAGVEEFTRFSPEGYEGNAQSFRIVTALSISDAIPRDRDLVAGLNLTAATLNALLKYPWLYGENARKAKKWGSYATERGIYKWARSESKPQVRSVEAEIMDWADDITYAIHDMVDFYCAGLIPLHVLGSQNGGDLSRRERERFFDAVCSTPGNEHFARNRARYEEELHEALWLAGLDGPYVGSQEQTSILWRFSSELLAKYAAAIKLVDPTESREGRCVEIGTRAGDQANILKQLTWHYVILRSDLATLQRGQQQMIDSLFNVYSDAIADERWEFFPPGFAQLIQGGPNVGSDRWAADYISGLTEKQVLKLYRRLCGRE